jgi:hypothetical protein
MPGPWRRLPIAVRFLISHAAFGFAAAGIFVGGLLVTDPGGVGTLLLTGADHWWPAAMLWGLVGLTFGSVQIGVAVMTMGKDDEPPPPGGTRAPIGLVPVRIPVRVPARRRR